jgi:hypothetical protein
LRNLLLFLEKRYRTHPYNGNYGGWFQFLEREWREDELPGMFGTAIATRLSCLILNILSECGENTLWFHKEDKIQHGITWLLKNRNPDGSFRMPM